MVLIPVVNSIFMLVMCLVPSKPGEHWSTQRARTSDEGQAKSAVLAVGASLIVGAVMLLVSVYLLSAYGASLFLGTPFLMGATAAYLFNRPHPRSYLSSMGVGGVAVLVAGLALLLFALEGLICVVMALPLLVPIGVLGGVIGKAIADATQRPAHELMASLLILPLLAGAESMLIHITGSTEYEVLTAVEIDAPPSVVWANVVDFPDLTEPPLGRSLPGNGGKICSRGGFEPSQTQLPAFDKNGSEPLDKRSTARNNKNSNRKTTVISPITLGWLSLDQWHYWIIPRPNVCITRQRCKETNP